MLLEIPCKAGTLQVLEEGCLQVQTAQRRVWIVPYASVTKLTAHAGGTMLTLLVHTTQGIYQAEMVTRQDLAKLQALFPHLDPDRIKRTRQWRRG